MKVLVTGGGGFLGTWICRELIKRGYQVISVSRSTYPHLEELGVECRRADLGNEKSTQDAFEGVDAVFHVAAKAGMWGKFEDFYESNVTATRNVINACLKLGIKRLIYTSSPSVVFGDSDILGADEKLAYPKKYLCFYAETKAMAEKLVLDSNSDQLMTVALRPHLIWGPGDPHIFPKLIQRVRSGRLKRIGDGNNLVDIIYVENAAKAHVDAFVKSLTSMQVAGKAYFIAQDAPVNLWQFIDQVLAGYDLEPVNDQISFSLAFKIGWLMEKIFNLLGVMKPEPPMTRFVACNMAKSHYFSHQRAKADFGFHCPISVEEGLKKVFASRNKDVIDQMRSQQMSNEVVP